MGVGGLGSCHVTPPPPQPPPTHHPPIHLPTPPHPPTHLPTPTHPPAYPILLDYTYPAVPAPPPAPTTLDYPQISIDFPIMCFSIFGLPMETEGNMIRRVAILVGARLFVFMIFSVEVFQFQENTTLPLLGKTPPEATAKNTRRVFRIFYG